MRTFPASEVSRNPQAIDEIVGFLAAGGVVCLPCGGNYRLVCDPRDEGAVIELLQLKRRTRNAPSLVFVSGAQGLEDIADDLPEAARTLAQKHWPGPLTILVKPAASLPKKVRKALTKANKHIGVRVPADEVTRAVIEAFGGPLLVTSANREKKLGSGSGAIVRQTFGGRIAAFIDAGELAPSEPSTVISVSGGAVKVQRAGALSIETLQASLA